MSKKYFNTVQPCWNKCPGVFTPANHQNQPAGLCCYRGLQQHWTSTFTHTHTHTFNRMWRPHSAGSVESATHKSWWKSWFILVVFVSVHLLYKCHPVGVKQSKDITAWCTRTHATGLISIHKWFPHQTAIYFHSFKQRRLSCSSVCH